MARAIFLAFCLSLSTVPAHAEWRCGRALLDWAQDFWPPAQAFDRVQYALALERWRAVLNMPSAQNVRDALIHHGTPADWLALHDVLLDRSVAPLAESISTLESRGVQARWFATGPILRTQLTWGRQLGANVSKTLLRAPKRLFLRLPRKIPEPEGVFFHWLAQSLTALNVGVSSALLTEGFNPSPPLTLPLGAGKFSFPARYFNAVDPLETRAYEFAFGFQQAFGQAFHAFPREKLEPPGIIGEGARYLWRTVFPLGAAVRWQPQTEVYEAYRRARRQGETPAIAFAALRDAAHAPFRPALRVQYFTDRYRELLLASSLVGTSIAGFTLGQLIYTGAWRDYRDVWQGTAEILADPEQTRQAMEEFAADEQGDAVVLEHYNAQIRALEAGRPEGDPADSPTAKAIEALRIQRDLLAH